MKSTPPGSDCDERLVASAADSRLARRLCLRSLLVLAGASAWAASPLSHAVQSPHGEVRSIDALARAAWLAHKPIVLMFSLPGCPWCDALRTEHLNGLAAQQEALRIRFIELNLSERRPFADGAPPQQPNTTGTRFWWQASSPADCARNLQVRMAPTVLFMGPEGEIAERLVGYGSPDFYGAYLEQRIAQAHASIRQTNRP